MGDRGTVLSKKVDEINADIMKVKKEMLNAKGMRKKTLQQKAMMLLKRRKMYDGQLGNVQNQQFSVDQVAFNSESMQTTLDTVSTIED